jgi:hypothetical protein
VSEVAEDAVVRLLMADYAAVDAAGKVNIIGGGISGLGYQPNIGVTSAFALVAWIIVPPKHYHAECAVEIVLEDVSGNVVSLPGPAGNPQAVRIGQAVRFDEAKSPPGVVRGALPSRTQWVMAFANGLPLPMGQKYRWRIKIDTQTRDAWTEDFVVSGVDPTPVFG